MAIWWSALEPTPNWTSDMGVYRWTTRLSWAYRGTTPATAIYLGTTKIRPTSGGSYTPNAYTVAYRPLNWDVQDHNTNWIYHWTIGGGATFYDTLSSWIKTLKFTWSNYGTQDRVCYPFTDANKLAWPYTISLYIWNTTYRTSRYNDVWIIEWKWTNDVWLLYWTSTELSSNQQQRIYMEMVGRTRPSLSQIPVTFPYTWYFHYAVTIDANYKHTYYINGSYVREFTSYWPPSYSWVNWMLLWADNNWYLTDSERRFIWNMSEIIIERKVWTASEVSTYYNNTKSNYWIS